MRTELSPARERTAPSDYRSEIAKARDEFFGSREGLSIMRPDLLRNFQDARFLRNRLEMAFLAGIDAGKKLGPTIGGRRYERPEHCALLRLGARSPAEGLSRIVRVVSESFGLGLDVFSSKCRRRDWVFGRHVAIWCAWQSRQFARRDIADFFGVERTLVLYACEHIENERACFELIRTRTDQVLHELIEPHDRVGARGLQGTG